MTITEELMPVLYAQQDLKYKDFNASLIPADYPLNMIGVRVPVVRTIAKHYKNRRNELFNELPHSCYELNLMHALMINDINDYEEVLVQLERFLPYVMNWAICDAIKPKVFKKHTAELMQEIRRWTASDNPWIIRFGVEMLMTYELDDAFREEYNDIPSSIHSGEYYVNMMIGWYFATALAKHWDASIKYVEENRIDPIPKRMTIRKAIESFRITPQQKAYLRTLK